MSEKPRSIVDENYGCLASQHDLGYAGFRALTDSLGSAGDVYRASPEARKVAYRPLSEACEASIAKGPDFAAWSALRARCAEMGVRPLAPDDAGFPEPLRALGGPPPLLYLQGEWLPRDARAAALV